MPSELQAKLASLDVKERCAAVTSIAERLAAAIRAHGDDPAAADKAVGAMKAWVAGEAVSGRAFSDLVYDDEGEGVALHTLEGEYTAATPEWSALTVAVMYVAWHAYRKTGEAMPEDVSEVDEDTLAMLDELWAKTASYDLGLIAAR